MKISTTTTSPLNLSCDLLVIGYSQDKKDTNQLFHQIDKKLKKEISNLIKKEQLKGATGECKLIYTKGKLKSDYLFIVGLGNKESLEIESLRKAGASIMSIAKQIKAKKVISSLLGTEFSSYNEEETAQAVSEGLLLETYAFNRYLKTPKVAVEEFTLYCHPSKKSTAVKNSTQFAQIVTQGVCLARDLINTPAVDMTPLQLAKTAKKISGVQTRIHNLQAIKKLKMGAYLSVAQGSSANPPYFIEMHYKPKTKAKKKIAIVGKGVTFDTGGYSIKPAKAMETMKDDMAGAAAVIGLMSIISKLKPKVEVSGYVAATENMVDGFAQRPGDICRSYSGKTIEVLNTDAEGRLTLADALAYANKRKPDYMIDMATLTGACLVALGMRYTGIMGNDQKLIDNLIQCGNHTGEKLWQLPLAPEYRDELKSPIADLKNVGSGYAGTITAALFLEHFVDKTKWAHMDIAGPSWTSSPLPYTPQGGTGVMVRTLAKFLCDF